MDKSLHFIRICFSNMVVFFCPCFPKFLIYWKYVKNESITKLLSETGGLTTNTVQLSLFKLQFTYEQLNLIISAKLCFTAVRNQKNNNLNNFFLHFRFQWYRKVFFSQENNNAFLANGNIPGMVTRMSCWPRSRGKNIILTKSLSSL